MFTTHLHSSFCQPKPLKLFNCCFTHTNLCNAPCRTKDYFTMNCCNLYKNLNLYQIAITFRLLSSPDGGGLWFLLDCSLYSSLSLCSTLRLPSDPFTLWNQLNWTSATYLLECPDIDIFSRHSNEAILQIIFFYNSWPKVWKFKIAATLTAAKIFWTMFLTTSRLYCLDTLYIKCFNKISLSTKNKEIEANLCFCQHF